MFKSRHEFGMNGQGRTMNQALDDQVLLVRPLIIR